MGSEGELAVEEALKVMKRKRKRPTIWQCVKKNIYTHRRRKTQRGDDVMICQCSPREGRGCGSNCINRVLNLECVQTKAGPKGYGLCAAEDIKCGQFLIEYIGEVLEEEEYARRKGYYAATGQRHYYFMNIGNGEVIDACRKGNLGRFINHSCEPNCETQKWVVRGELAIGLFALKDIQCGAELTFDYNFERYGDRPMLCYCGTPSCRGYIGGTPGEKTQEIVEGSDPIDSSDEEDVPIMVDEHIDPVLTSILNKEVGIRDDLGFSAVAMRERLEALFLEHNIDVQPGDSGEEDEAWVELMLNCGLEDSSMVGGTMAHGNKLTRVHARSGRNSQRKKNVPQESSQHVNQLFSASLLKTNAPRESKADMKEALEGLARKHRHKNRAKRSESPGKSDRMRKSTTASASGGSSEGLSSEPGKSWQSKRPFHPPRQANYEGCNSGVSRSVDKFVLPNTRIAAPEYENTIKIGCKNDKEKDAAARSRSTYNVMFPSGEAGVATSESEGYFIMDTEEVQKSARQRVQEAHLSLLLDVLIKAQFTGTKKLFVKCGALSQLQKVMGRNFGKEHSVIVRKILKAVDSLPFSTEDVEKTKSNHGSFLNLLRVLWKQHSDAEVCRLSCGLLKKYDKHHPFISSTRVSHDTNARFSQYSAHNRGHYSVPMQGGRGFGRNSRWPHSRLDQTTRPAWVSPRASPCQRTSTNGTHYSSQRDRKDFISRGEHSHYHSRLGHNPGSHRHDPGIYVPPAPSQPYSLVDYNRSSNAWVGSASSNYRPNGQPKHLTGEDIDATQIRFPAPPPPPPPPPPAPPEKSPATGDSHVDIKEDHNLLTLTPLQHGRDATPDYVAEPGKSQWIDSSTASHRPGLPPANLNGENAANMDTKTAAGIHGWRDDDAPDASSMVKEMDVEDMFAAGIYGCAQNLSSSHYQGRRSIHKACCADTNQDARQENGYREQMEHDMPLDQGHGIKRKEFERFDFDESLHSSENRSKIARFGTPQGLSGIRQIYLQWEEPNEDFEAFVSSTLKRKIFKYVQDDHPRRISKEDADSLYKRIMVEIIDIERKAFNEHEKNNTRRPIDGWKLESNIKEHVKSRVYRLHARSYSQGRPRHF